MTNILNWDAALAVPKNVCANAKNAAKTMYLMTKIEAMTQEGVDLASAAASYLPMSNPTKIREDVGQLEAGVNDVYANMDEAVGAEWLELHMNEVMSHLDNRARVSYASNLLELVPAESVDPAMKAQIGSIKNQDDVSAEDVHFVAEVVKDIFADDAGVLTRSTVMAMESVMHELPPEVVKELGDAGRKKALAYAAACYVMNQCGENPWSADDNIAEQLPYTVGVIAAANTESSRLMTLYYTGKVKLLVLKEKLTKLFRNAITFLADHAAFAVAVGLQVVLGLTMFQELILLFYSALHFGPWVSMIGAAVLSVLALTQVITTQNMMDLVNGAWNLVQRAWNACKNALKAILHKDTVEEDEAVEETEEYAVVEEVEEVEEDAEAEEDVFWAEEAEEDEDDVSDEVEV